MPTLDTDVNLFLPRGLVKEYTIFIAFYEDAVQNFWIHEGGAWGKREPLPWCWCTKWCISSIFPANLSALFESSSVF